VWPAMGRFAHFNSGVEFKFAFGLQDSQDMTQFKGQSEIIDDSFARHRWNKNEQADIMIILEKIIPKGYKLPDFESYPKDIDGTTQLKKEFLSQLDDKEADREQMKIYYLTLLGCLIYHQLNYITQLEVVFEY
jgi:hypothetical protein